MLIVEFRVKRQDNMAESWYQILNFFFFFLSFKLYLTVNVANAFSATCLLQFQQQYLILESLLNFSFYNNKT
jgi:hypothetical protein